jgi:hypothetical protein
VLTRTSAAANRTTIMLNGVAVFISIRLIRSCPSAMATNVPTM